MFHQVFIYDPTEDEDPSRGLNLEQSKNESPHTVKEENPSESATMGFVQTEDLKIAVKELKSEQQSLISTQQVMKSDTETPQVNLETKNILNVTSCTNAVFPMNQTRQEFILPVADEQEIQPQPLTSSPAQFIIQEPQETTAVQSLGPSLISLLPQPALIGPMQLLSAPMAETGPGIVPATQVLDSAISQASTLKIDPSSCLSDVDMSEEQEGGSTVMINSEIKIENEELPVKSADLEDTQVHQSADKLGLQEFHETNSSVVGLEVKHSGTNKKRGVHSILGSTNLTSEDNLKFNNPESVKHIEKKNRTKITESQLKKMFNIKDCTVAVNRCISQNFIPGKINGSILENKVVPTQNEYVDTSDSDTVEKYTDNSDCSDWEEEYSSKIGKNQKCRKKEISKNIVQTPISQNFTPGKTLRNILENKVAPTLNEYVDTSDSDREEKYTDDDSDCSDWEEEYSSKIGKNQKRHKKELSKNIVETPQIINHNNHPIQKTNKPCTLTENLKCDLTKGDKFSKTHTADQALTSATLGVSLPKKTSFNLSIKISGGNIIRPHFIGCPKNIQDQFNPTSKLFNALTKEKNSTHTKLKQKKNKDSPRLAQNRNQNVTHRKHSSELRTVPSGLQHNAKLSLPSFSENKRGKKDSSINVPSVNDPKDFQIPYHCGKCDKYFQTLYQFKGHKYSSCAGYQRKADHQCDICGRCFTGRQKLEAHVNSHTNARPFKCSDCDKCFNSKIARYSHYKSMHLNMKTRFLCCFCGYLSQSAEHIKAHEEEHRLPEGCEAPKPFKCLICGKGFISRWKQQYHNKEHSLKKCNQCSDTFKTDSLLIKHKEAVHGIIKTYDCKECGMQFKLSGSLREHRKTHSTVLEYFCDVCDKGFKRKNNLQQHMITHSDDRPISCPKCGDKFKRITHLNQHIAALHSDEKIIHKKK